MDYSPVAEGVELGRASEFAQMAPSTEYQLDVSNSNTTANLLSRSSVSFLSGGVYTMFMSSNATTA
ncbi:MAG TPA: hypothetical protein VNA21_03550, partial [Steroidobacteraceae bacterium]|nr:hypothetical protein [Steroidobacteraceae bacterium]